MQRYFIRLAFDGARYHGWQIQDNAHTVQAELNNGLSLLLKAPVETAGCGRTDTGVHAREFFAHFDVDQQISDPHAIVSGLNNLLPNDMAVYDLFAVPGESHARFDALSRTYQYLIVRKKDPFSVEKSHYLYGKLATEPMKEATGHLFAYEDFTSFSKSHTQVKTNHCRIMKAEWSENDDMLIFTITADRFLRNMVRAIVGTLIAVGQGKLSAGQFKQVIESKDRRRAGASAPAHGLYLTKVEYPKKITNMHVK